jgi:hypothetical protein
MLVYSVPVALYLAYIGIAGASAGVLLWPAVIVHVFLSGLIWAAARNDK